MTKIHIFLGVYVCFLFVAYLAYWQSAYSIARFSMHFTYKDELGIMLCNPTNQGITFYDGVGFGQNNSFLERYVVSISYKTEDGRVEVLKKAEPNSLGGAPIAIKKGKISPGECLRKKDSIRNFLSRLETKINKFEKAKGREGISITAFQIKVTIYKYYSSYIKLGTKSYESQWYDLQN